MPAGISPEMFANGKMPEGINPEMFANTASPETKEEVDINDVD
jgi:hypothetical protein